MKNVLTLKFTCGICKMEINKDSGYYQHPAYGFVCRSCGDYQAEIDGDT